MSAEQTSNGTSRDARLTIGAFASRSHLSPKALRLYDRLGVLVPAEVDTETGYRRYREGQLETARLISLLRRLDMPLATINDILALPESARSTALATWWDDVERRIDAQRDLLMYVLIRLAGKERSSDMFTIEQRDIPDQLVMTEQRHIFAADLPAWLEQSIGRMWDVAPGVGGIVGPVFVIFHGEVSAESDGPVEVCAPISADGSTPLTMPTRIEPAHREAFTRIPRSMLEYPQILTAYEAVEAWLTSNNHPISGSPREVYFTDVMAAGPDDLVCDIAFPYSS
jgi:DNA-binding transcriptional MerR regulator